MFRAMISLEIKVFEIVSYLFRAGLLAQCIDSVGRLGFTVSGWTHCLDYNGVMPFLWHL